MFLDGTPIGRIGRVVDDDQAFVIGVFEPRHRIERGLEHLGRLAMGGDVNRHLGRKALGRGHRGGDQPARAAPECNRGDLLYARQRDHHQRNEQHDAKAKREGGAPHEVMALPEGKHDREPGTRRIGGNGRRDRLGGGGARPRQGRQRH